MATTRNSWALLAMATLIGAAVADQPQAQEGAPTAPRVLATTGMIADVARNVAGDCVEVAALMGPGVDPHLYKASAGDVRELQQAAAILYSGFALEGQLGAVLEKFAEQKPTVAVAPAAIGPANLIMVQDGHGIDPHVWMDAGLWARTAAVIAAALGDIVPDCAAAMAQRASAYETQLAALDRWIGDSVATIPAEQKILVTAHDAFNYFGRAYGIEVAGIQGISTESEAGVADVRAIVDIVVARQVPAVFVESTINPRTIQAVIDAAAQRGQTIELGGELYSDAMGAPGTPGGTYLGMLFANTRSIVEGLGGRLAPLPPSLGEWARAWRIEIAAQ